jgi:hypothetical protein
MNAGATFRNLQFTAAIIDCGMAGGVIGKGGYK